VWLVVTGGETDGESQGGNGSGDAVGISSSVACRREGEIQSRSCTLRVWCSVTIRVLEGVGCGVIVVRVNSAIDWEGCVMESGCRGAEKGCDCVVIVVIIVIVIIVIGRIDPDGEGWAMDSGCRGEERCGIIVVAIVIIVVVVVAGFAVTGKSCAECSCRGVAVEVVGSCVEGVFGWLCGENGFVVVGFGNCSNSQKLARIWSQQVARALSSVGASSR